MFFNDQGLDIQWKVNQTQVSVSDFGFEQSGFAEMQHFKAMLNLDQST